MLELHDPLRFEPGKVPFAAENDPSGMATVNRFVRENALSDDVDEDDWPDGRILHAHLVMLDQGRLVGSGMIVHDEWDEHCKLVSFAVAPEYRDPHLIWLFEDALAGHDWLEPGFGYVQVSGGRRIAIPDIADLQHVS